MQTYALEVVVPGRLLALHGRLDVVAAADTRLALADQLDAGGSGDLVVDLGQVRSADLTGVGVLVGAHRRAGRVGRRLVLQDAPADVSRLLHVTRLDRVLHQRRSASAA